MKFAVLVFLLLFGVSSYGAGMIAEDEAGNVVLLSDTPCAEKAILKHVPEGVAPHLQAGSMTYQGKKYAACWLVAAEGVIVLTTSGNQNKPDAYVIPFGAFRATTSI